MTPTRVLRRCVERATSPAIAAPTGWTITARVALVVPFGLGVLAAGFAAARPVAWWPAATGGCLVLATLAVVAGLRGVGAGGVDRRTPAGVAVPLADARGSGGGAPSRSTAPASIAADGGVEGGATATVADYDGFLEECRAAVSATGEGDLTRRIQVDAPSETLHSLAREYNEMSQSLERTIDTTREFSEDVHGSAEHVVDATGTVKDASDSVAETVQEIADVFADQHRQVEEISEVMNDMSATIEEISASTDEVADQAEATHGRTDHGIAAAREARQTMHAVQERMDDVAGTVEELDDRMEEVWQIVDLIDDVADRTRMLALNASIQAANASTSRNGDDEGFQVVADEVKDLAGETREATGKIEELIGNVRAVTDDTIDEIRETQDLVDEGMETVDDGVDSLEEVLEHVERTTSGIEEINAATDEQATASEEVATIARDAADTSTENVDRAENVAAIAEEQSLMLGEMQTSTKMLAMRARQLSELFEDWETR